MNLLIILLIVLLLFGGGGWYGNWHASYPQAYWGGSGLLTVLIVVVLVMALSGRL